MTTANVWKKFEENELTHSTAHHLLAIMDLRQEHGYARVSDVARYLKITSGSASLQLKTMKAKKLVAEDSNRFLKLTASGAKQAELVFRRREIIKRFLSEILHIDPRQAEVDACKTEHLVSMKTASELERLIERCKKCHSAA